MLPELDRGGASAMWRSARGGLVAATALLSVLLLMPGHVARAEAAEQQGSVLGGGEEQVRGVGTQGAVVYPPFGCP